MTENQTGEHLTERQRKWFASVQASLERDTGKTLAEWVAIARSCPESTPSARTRWLKENHGLGVNRAAHVLSQAFPSGMGWDQPEKLRAALWTDPASLAILQALDKAVADLPDLVMGQRKTFTAWSRKVQFAAAKPMRGGGALLGLAVPTESSPRLVDRDKERWSERLKAKVALASPADVDADIAVLLRAAWGRS